MRPHFDAGALQPHQAACQMVVGYWPDFARSVFGAGLWAAQHCVDAPSLAGVRGRPPTDCESGGSAWAVFAAGPTGADGFTLDWPALDCRGALDKSDPAFLESVQRAMQGDFASFYPQRWIAYEQRSEEVRQLLYPLAALENRPGMAALRELIENKTGLSPAQQDAQLGYLPLVQGATLDWVAVLNKTTALPVAYGHVDGW